MIIVRYLIKETLKSQLAVFFVLFLVFFSQQFITVLSEASDGDIPASLILKVVILNMPAMGLLMLPLSLYVGILLTFGRLYAESEITVMSATGMGNKFLVRAALYLAIITGAIAFVNSIWIAPLSQQKVTQLMAEVKSNIGLELLKAGQFQMAPDGASVVFVDEIANNQLTNIFVAQPNSRDSIRPSVMFSNTGNVQEMSDGRQVLTLNDGRRYEGNARELDFMNSSYKDYSAVIGHREIPSIDLDWDALPTAALFLLDTLPAKAELLWRLSLIICIPLLTLVVVPLSAVNPRQGRFAKLAPAVLIYLAYFLSISAVKSAIESGSVHWSVMLMINVFLLLAGIILNSMNSLFVRRIKDGMRKKRLKHV